MTKAMWTAALACAAAVLTLTAPARAADDAKKAQPYVVVVGVSHYTDKQLLPRAHAEDDAKALFDLYTSKDYFGVDAEHARLLIGDADGKGSQAATRQNILDALKWLAKEAGPNDPVIFAFFGDGGPLGDTGDRHCYFAADSTFKGREKDAVAAAEVAEALKGLKSQQLRRLPRRQLQGLQRSGRQGHRRAVLHRQAVRGVPRRPRLERRARAARPAASSSWPTVPIRRPWTAPNTASSPWPCSKD